MHALCLCQCLSVELFVCVFDCLIGWVAHVPPPSLFLSFFGSAALCRIPRRRLHLASHTRSARSARWTRCGASTLLSTSSSISNTKHARTHTHARAHTRTHTNTLTHSLSLSLSRPLSTSLDLSRPLSPPPLSSVPLRASDEAGAGGAPRYGLWRRVKRQQGRRVCALVHVHHARD